MMNLYSGTPGSGKSLHAAKDIYFALKYGRDVIANFEINENVIVNQKATFTCIDNWNLTPDILKTYALEHAKKSAKGKIIEDSILLVIDEAQLLFNSRETRQGNRMAWLTFFSQHRHYGYEIIFMAQFDRMIDRQIRSLFEYNYKHRKVGNYGWKGFILSVFFGGKLFLYVKMWYGMNEKVGSEFFTLRKKFSEIYDSYKLFETSEQVGD